MTEQSHVHLQMNDPRMFFVFKLKWGWSLTISGPPSAPPHVFFCTIFQSSESPVGPRLRSQDPTRLASLHYLEQLYLADPNANLCLHHKTRSQAAALFEVTLTVPKSSQTDPGVGPGDPRIISKPHPYPKPSTFSTCCSAAFPFVC